MALMELVFVGEIHTMENKDIDSCETTVSCLRRDLDSLQRTVDLLVYDSQHRVDTGRELIEKCEHIDRLSRGMFHLAVGFSFALTLWLVSLVIQMLK